METQSQWGGGGEGVAQVQLSVCLSGGFVTAPLSVRIPAHLLWMKHGQPSEEGVEEQDWGEEVEEKEGGGQRLGGGLKKAETC